MRDLKRTKARKPRANRAKREKQPIRWKKFFHRLLTFLVLSTSGVLILAGGILGSQLLLASDMFHVDQVRVEGNERLPAREVVAQSNIQTGQSTFDLELEKIGAELQKNPWIREAAVQRIFPRLVVINIREREPVAIVNLGYLYYVDKFGEVFKVLSSADSLDLPVVTGVGRELYLRDRKKAQQQLKKVVSLIAHLNQRKGFRLDHVSELNIDRQNNIRLYTTVGAVPIRLGQDRFAAKLDRMERVYGELQPRLRALESIDLRVDGRVIVKISKKEPRRV